MFQIKNVAISIFIIIGTCSFALVFGATAEPVSDTILINNVTETIPAITEVNEATTPSFPPQPTIITSTLDPINTTTTAKPTTTTPITTISPTPAPKTTTSTTTPAPNITTPAPKTTTITPNVTTSTLSPNSTTPIPVTTVKPTAGPPTTPIPSHRRFDGPSFIGGIVLALGLVAIGFVAFKFYKARTELNYHTL